MMANTASTSTPSLAIHVHAQSQHPHKHEIVNPSHDSIANLRNLSVSLSAFQRCFAEVHQHIDSIRDTIHSVLPLLTTNTTLLPASSPPPAVSPAPEPETSWESDPSEEEEEEVQSPRGEEVQSYHSEEVKSPDRSELESICKLANGRLLRRYMVRHLSDMNRLLEEVPDALRLSPNPARLVLECMGKFYVEGGDPYTKGSHMVRAREAAVLVLVCFLLMRIDGVEIEKAVKEEAEKAALAWRDRLIAEGGVKNAYEVDARGLLLLIGCFGIPERFTNEDIRDLLLISYIRRISGALRRSSVLITKIPEIIEGMVKQNMKVDAVHIAFTFGIEDRFNPQRLLTSFLLDSEESLKKMKKKSLGSLAVVHEAKRKHLFALTSVIKCLKLHDIDPSKLLPAWKINEKIMALEEEIDGFDKQICKTMAQKRENDETESSRRSRNKEARRSCIPQDSAAARRSHPICSQCGKNHPGRCLLGQSGCFGCGQVGHRLKDCPSAKFNEKIMALEEEIDGFDKQICKTMAQKRENDETESSRRSRNKAAKRSCIPQDNTAARRSHPICSQCGKNHPGRCLLGQNGCFGCGQVGHRLKDCPSAK